MNIEKRQSLSVELSQFEQAILQTQIEEFINHVWAGPHDRKYFPINKQIAIEELEIKNSMYHLKRESGSYRKKRSLDPSGVVSLIAGAVERAEGRSSRRLRQLTNSWYQEDARVRHDSGANWSDLWEVLAPLDIKPVDPSKLRRPHNRSITTEQEDLLQGFSDTYFFTSESKKPQKLYNSDQTVDVPAHIVELFGNEVTFSEEDFDATLQRLGIKSNQVYQIKASDVDSLTYLPVFEYRVVVPYKNWLLVSGKWFYNKKPACPQDKTQEFKYWEGSLLPEVLVLPNRGKDISNVDEGLGFLAPDNGKIH